MRVNEYDTSEPYSPVGFRRGKQGFYLYGRADLKQESLLYVAYAGDGVRRIDLPSDARRVRGVIESPGQGLLVAAHSSGRMANEMVYFMPPGGQTWVKREIPAEFCPHFLPEQSGASLRLVCTQGQFRSVDLGKTWNRLPDDVAMR
jgi:predicted RNA-binding protein